MVLVTMCIKVISDIRNNIRNQKKTTQISRGRKERPGRQVFKSILNGSVRVPYKNVCRVYRDDNLKGKNKYSLRLMANVSFQQFSVLLLLWVITLTFKKLMMPLWISTNVQSLGNIYILSFSLQDRLSQQHRTSGGPNDCTIRTDVP